MVESARDVAVRPEEAPARPSRGAPRSPRSRPDPRPGRLVLAAGAVAALSVIGAGLVRFPVDGSDAAVPAPEPRRASAKVRVEGPVRYIRLKPGQKAPPGARVIREAAPTPRIVYRYAPAPAAQPVRSVRRTVTRTRQSGG